MSRKHTKLVCPVLSRESALNFLRQERTIGNTTASSSVYFKPVFNMLWMPPYAARDSNQDRSQSCASAMYAL